MSFNFDGRSPVPVDDNGWPIPDRGREVYTTRYSGMTDAISGVSDLGLDYKEILIHAESGDDWLLVSGGVTGSTIAHLTLGGNSLQLPIVYASGDTAPFGVGVPSGAPEYISVIAWR